MQKTEEQISNERQWEDAPDFLTPIEAAKLIKIGRNQMYNLCRIESFPAVKLGRNIRIPKKAFKNWLENQAANKAKIEVG